MKSYKSPEIVYTQSSKYVTNQIIFHKGLEPHKCQKSGYLPLHTARINKNQHLNLISVNAIKNLKTLHLYLDFKFHFLKSKVRLN